MQSAPQVAIPVLPLDAPSPTSDAASRSTTRARVEASRQAIAQPTTPPPTIATSYAPPSIEPARGPGVVALRLTPW